MSLADARTGIATSLQGGPDGAVWLPNEVDVSIRRPDWFWSTTNANKVLTIDQLLSIYYRSIGRGAQLLLNIPANRDGLLPQPDCNVAAGFGKERQRRFGSPLATTHGAGSSLVLTFDHPLRIDTVVLQEQISQGDRIRTYRIEGRVAGTWKLLAEGSAVGHKRIQPVPSQVISTARLLITKSVAEPIVRTFSVFDTGGAPRTDWNAAASVWSSTLLEIGTGENFSLDLTQHISVAGQYILRFRSQEHAVTGFGDEVLELGGTPAPGMVRTSRVRRDELLLNITGLDRSIRVRGRVLGANAGVVLLRRQ
jgi:alpha-L-fucosidase